MYNILCYCTLNSLVSSFLIGRKLNVLWIFEISARDVIIVDFTIIMSGTLKVTGNHVMYEISAWFLRAVTSSSRALFKGKNGQLFFFSSVYNKKLFCDIHNKQGLAVRVISISLRLQLITQTCHTSTLIILDITCTLSNNCLLYLPTQITFLIEVEPVTCHGANLGRLKLNNSYSHLGK